ncbi:MAG: LOG family protein [Microgenomates group bacterium]
MTHKNKEITFKKVAFFGDAAVLPDSSYYQAAYHSAKKLAKMGYIIVNGGGPGVMDAATRGAESVGGITESVTFYPEHATGFEGRYLSNITDKEIKTKNYIERMYKLMEQSDIFLIFQGGTGTISELGTAWVLAKLYYGHHKPFILVGAFWRPVIGALHDNLLIDAREMDVFRIVDSIDQILPKMKELEEALNKIDHSHCQHCAESAFMS